MGDRELRALVTGGAGFVGSALVDALVDRGDTVVVLDDLSRGSVANLGWAIAAGARLVRADVRDEPVVAAAARSFAPEVVFHLAAQIDVRHSVSNPAHDAAVNVVGTVNVLAAAAASGARRVVLSSSGGALYGDSEVIPTPEDVRPRPFVGVRPEQVGGRVLRTVVRGDPSARGGQPAVRQRLRTAAGAPR